MLASRGEEGDGAALPQRDIGEVGRQRIAQPGEIVLGIAEDAAGVIEAQNLAAQRVVPYAASQDGGPEHARAIGPKRLEVGEGERFAGARPGSEARRVGKECVRNGKYEGA